MVVWKSFKKILKDRLPTAYDDTMRQKLAKWLIKVGYWLYGPRNTAGIVVNPKGKWQPIKL